MSYEPVIPKWDSHRETLRLLTILEGPPEDVGFDIQPWMCFICLGRANGKSKGICQACEKEFPIKRNHQ